MNESFFFNRDHLEALAERCSPDYRSADPFPHVVIDDFLPEGVLDAVLSEFPSPGDIEWWTFDSPQEKKLGTVDDRVMGAATRHLLAELNSATMIDFLQSLTGIKGLVPDPHFYGGGLHQIESGGFLKVHADFNIHPTTNLERRLNLLIYLNKNWDPSYEGALELWNRDMTACARRIDPEFNRCVIFTTTDHSYHGHPVPLRTPPGLTRKSLAMYYYSAPLGGGGEHNTIFRQRPGETIQMPQPPGRTESAARRLARQWLPPALANAIRQRRSSSDRNGEGNGR